MNVGAVIGAALAIGGLASAAYLWVRRGAGRIGRLLGSYTRWLDQQLGFSFLDVSPRGILGAQLVCGFLLLLAGALAQDPRLLVGVAVVSLAPPLRLVQDRRKRLADLERQLDTWLLLLANALKVSPSVGEAIASTATLAPRPFADEVHRVVKELRLGSPLDRALEAAGRRIGSAAISGAFSAIVIARQAGGDLGSTLESASAALRETARLDGVLRTKTAEGRGQVLVLAVTPFLLCAAIGWLDPRWFTPMVENTHGLLLLGACGVTWLAATMWARRIVRVDV